MKQILKSLYNLSNENKYFLLCFSFFFGVEVSKYVLALFVLLLIIAFIPIWKSRSFKPIKPKQFLSAILYLVFCAGVLYSENKEFYFLEKSLLLLLMPFLFLNAKLSTTTYHNALKGLVYGALVAGVTCVLIACWHSIVVSDSGLAFDTRVLKDERIDQLQSITWGGNYFFSSYLSFFIHPSYFAMYLIFAICILIETEDFLSSSKKIAMALFFIGIILLLSSRASFITLAAMGLYYMWKYPMAKGKKIALMSFALGVMAIVFVYHPRTKNIYKSVVNSSLTINPKSKQSHMLRLQSWHSAYQIIKDNWIFGIGVGDVQPALNEQYSKLEYSYALKNQYNAHNVYVQTLLASGIIALILLLVMLWYVPFKVSNPLFHAFILLISINFVFESMLSQYAGVSFFTFFYCLFMFSSKNQIELKTKQA